MPFYRGAGKNSKWVNLAIKSPPNRMHTHQYANIFSAPVASYGSFVEKKKLFLHVGWKLVIIALIYDLHVNLRASYVYGKADDAKKCQKNYEIVGFREEEGGNEEEMQNYLISCEDANTSGCHCIHQRRQRRRRKWRFGFTGRLGWILMSLSWLFRLLTTDSVAS